MSITARAITKTYRSGDENVAVLKDLDFSISGGQSAAIVGPSGSGKSTFLNLIGALDTPDHGVVTVGETDLMSLDVDDLAEMRNSNIGFVFQAHHLLPQCTVMENILIPTLVRGRDEREMARTRALWLLESIGLADKGHRFPTQLSGGERLRVAVARALVNRPGIVLADEPTGSLDADTAGQVMDLLMDLSNREEVTLVVVTHSSAVAKRLADTYVLSQGRLQR